jgi:hypothetical protein
MVAIARSTRRPAAGTPLGVSYLGNNVSKRSLVDAKVKLGMNQNAVPTSKNDIVEPYTTLSPAQKAKIEAEIAELKSKYLTTKSVKN